MAEVNETAEAPPAAPLTRLQELELRRAAVGSSSSSEAKVEVKIVKISDSIAKLMDVMTWAKVGMLGLVGLMVVLGYTWNDNRPYINKRIQLSVGRFGQSSIPNPSPITAANIMTMVNKSIPIVAVQLVNLDFQHNEKHPIFFYSDKADLTHAMAQYQSEKLSQSPLFITGDESNNARIVEVINGNFVCVDIPKRLIAAVPMVEKEAKALCSISIPPYYGKIVGYANLWLDHMPTKDEEPNFRAIARTLSVDVYERDINPGST